MPINGTVLLENQLIGRLEKIKEQKEFTFAELAAHFNLSGAFLSNLMTGKRRIRKKHMPLLLQRLGTLEGQPPGRSNNLETTETLVSELASRGYIVTLTRK